MNDINEKTSIKNFVTVIVPIYRVEKYLDECIESIVGQTYKNMEIILVDDGSDDSCAVDCDSWAMKDSRVTVLHKPNGGLSDARNKGIEIMYGDYVAFIDSDDWVDEKYIEKLLLTAIDEDADVVTCGHIDEIENTGAAIPENREYFSGNSEQALHMLFDQTKIGVNAFKLYRRFIWESLRYPYGKLYEDALTICDIFDLADKVVQIPDTLLHYRIRENSIMTAKFSLRILGISDAWKENYLFCKEKYPRVAPIARSLWLEMLPGIIEQFPKDMTNEEKMGKRKLKKELIDNLWFAFTKMPLKKVYYLVRAICFL